MMGAKNLRQAEPSLKGEVPTVWTGGEARLMEFVCPALQIGVCPKSELHENSDDAKGMAGLALGKDLLVAYLPWYGRNFEDAVVLGQQVVDNGWLDIALHRTPVRKPIPVGWVPCTDCQEDNLGTNGLAAEGSLLIAGRPIAKFMWKGGDGSQEPLTILHKDRTPAILKSIDFKRRSDWTGGFLEYTLETPISVKPGDKLMGRHGNKGVVGAILPESEMPKLPEDESIPEALRGRTIDILLNPHGVISRMNLGQLMETHLGWLLRAGGYMHGDFLTSPFAADHPLAEPFSTSLDHDKVRDALSKTGLDRYGRVKLVLPDGKLTASPVVVGFQHIVRLKHVPETKSQARRGGIGATYSARTGQAIHGRSLGGGQRIGEMEEWALAAHGADHVISEMLGVKSSSDLAVNWQPGKNTESGSREKDGFSRMLEQWALAADWQPGRNGFADLMEDWFFAMMIGMDRTGDHVKLRLVEQREVLGRAGEIGEVMSPEGLVAAPSSPFRCCEGEESACGYRLLDGAGIAFPSTAGGKAGQSSALCLTDYLSHLNLKIAGRLVAKEGCYELPVRIYQTGEIEEPVRLTFKPAKSALYASAKWKGSTFHLYGQFSNKYGPGKNFSGDELLQGLLNPDLRRPAIGRMRIACPHHPSKPLGSVEPYQFVRRSMPGGLFDPEIFGHNTSRQGSGTAPRWGFIRLPRPVSHPFAAAKGADEQARE